MSIESDAATESPGSNVDQLASEFGQAITELPVYERFVEAKAAVEADEEAQSAISEFEQIREEFMMARQTGQATQEDLRQVQAAQEDLHDIPVMSEFLEAQNDLELRLQELNELVSDELAIDFGEKAGGCCQD